MRTKRLRKPGGSETGQPTNPPRRTRVRNRLLASVALCSLAVLAAGAPGVVESSETLTESQELVEQATLHQRAIALAHSLADERGDMVAYVAAGRSEDVSGSTPGTAEPPAGREPTTDSQRARVDRQVTELLASDAVAPPVRQSLEELAETRRDVLTSTEVTAYDTFEAYSAVIQQLHAVSRNVARDLPGDHAPNSTAAAAVATTESLPHLGRAVEQASATRGLLRGAFAAEGPARTLTEAARLARVREQAALADFEQTAGATASETYDKTVTGTDVGLAERYIERLTADPVLDAQDRGLDIGRVVAALSTRIDRMRSVQSSLATAEVARLEQQRDDDVVALELTAGLVGACLLLAVGASVHTARSLARPLSVLRRGSKRLASAEEPDTEEPVRFHGRNDEFAEVVRSLNELRETAAGLQTRAREAEADNARLIAAKDELTAERERLREEGERLRARLEAARGATHGTFVHLGLRTLGLVERQLGILEAMEAEESDPDDLATLFKLDHLATRMRRAGENLLLLAGAEHTATHHAGPVPLLDVLRAAVSEIERYERVQIASLPPHAQVSGFAADDVSHLVAELLDNATAFSAPDAEVTLSAWMLENGDIMLSVQDEGIGVAEDRLAELNARLGDPAAQEAPGDGAEAEGLGNGLYVVARLAARHGLRVQLREQRQGGVAAVVVVPRALLPDRPVPGVAGAPASASHSGQSLPGSVAEANSNTLPVRTPAPRNASAAGHADEARSGSLAAEVPSGDAPAASAVEVQPDRAARTRPADGAATAAGGDAPATTALGAGAAGGARRALAETDERDAVSPAEARGDAPVAGAPAGEADPAAGGEENPAPPTSAHAEAVGAARHVVTETGDFGAEAAPALAGAAQAPVGDHADAGTPDGTHDAEAPAGESVDVARPGRPAADPAAGEPVQAGRASAGNAEGAAEAPAGETTRGELSPSRGEPTDGTDVDGTALGTQDGSAADAREHEWPGTMPAGSRPDAVPEPSRPTGADGAEHGRAEVPEEGGREAADVPAQREHDDREHPSADDGRQAPTVTDKGLPKRTPRQVAVDQQVRPATSGGANAEELRRRLGGFQRGAADGHRDAAAEVAVQSVADAGGTDEEAQQ